MTTTAEKPLSPGAKFFLILTAALSISLFYLLIPLVLTLILSLLTLELILIVALARFGMHGLMLAYFKRHIGLLPLIARSLWLRKGVDYRIELQRRDAPRLFALADNLAQRLQIKSPDAIHLEMNSGAWVELRGLRHNLGSTHLGLGFDLLATLSETEVEAVLAHEMAHAKLVRRALSRWLKYGLHRAATLNNQLSGLANTYRRANENFALCESLLYIFDKLTLLCARSVSRYSRQDEFEADHGAAQLCGSAPLRSSLQKLRAAAPLINRLPWNERVSQLRAATGFTEWLVSEFQTALNQPAATSATQPDLLNRYSTHPTLTDRLAALPDDHTQLQPSPNATGLLDQPDTTARLLLNQIELLQLSEERENLATLRRWRKSNCRQTVTLPAQYAGLAVAIGTLFGAIFSFADENPLGISLLIIVGGSALTYLLYRLGRYRDRHPLPIPSYDKLTAEKSPEPANPNPTDSDDTPEKNIENELRHALSTLKTVKQKLTFLNTAAYDALSTCDYLRAHVASRLAIKTNGKSLEAALAHAIATAAFGQTDTSGHNLHHLAQQTGLRTLSTSWGAAWALLLQGNFFAAEAILQHTLALSPDHPTLLASLALAQTERGKLQSALATLKRLPDTERRQLSVAKLHIRTLLNRGDLAAASDLLDQHAASLTADTDLQFSLVRCRLLQHRHPEAEVWITKMLERQIPGHDLCTIGLLYENARQDTKAAEFYNRALLVGHYPSAHLGLSRLAEHAQQPAPARQHALNALDCLKPLPPKAASPRELLAPIFGQLLATRLPQIGCVAWQIKFWKDIKHPVAGRTLMAYAPSDTDVISELQEILKAMYPGEPLQPPADIFQLTRAPADLQPDHPVAPGIQFIYA